MSIDLSTRIGNVQLDSCFYNASGPRCTTKEQLHEIGQSQSAAILTKSSTLELREGNPKPRYVENEWGSINSMGLPNKGYLYYAALIEEMATYNKPYFISVSGLSLDDNLTMLDHLNGLDGISGIELNLSCPNVPGKPQTAYDFEQTERVLEAVSKFDKHPLGVKLPPYFDLIHFEAMANILNRYPIQFVTCINSIGNALIIDPQEERVVIRPKDGFGGLGGDYIKPTALANVRQFYLRLREDIQVIACGGVKNAWDAFEHILCGAAAVQIGTQFMREGGECFKRLNTELKQIMQDKGYQNLSNFRGKLKTV